MPRGCPYDAGMTRLQRLGAILWMLAMASPSPVSAQTETGDALLARGEYVLTISGCSHCHTAEGGEPLAGGRALETPFGTFYTPNITAHNTTGIGAWSAEDFLRALQHGESPEGSDYYPAFPYTSYTRLDTDDVRAMYHYILSRPASDCH